MRSPNPPLCQCGNVLSQAHSGLQRLIWLHMTQKLAEDRSLLFPLRQIFAQLAETLGSCFVLGCRSQPFITPLPVNRAGRLTGFHISCNWTFLRWFIRLDWFTSPQTSGKWSVRAVKLYSAAPIETNTCRGEGGTGGRTGTGHVLAKCTASIIEQEMRSQSFSNWDVFTRILDSWWLQLHVRLFKILYKWQENLARV